MIACPVVIKIPLSRVVTTASHLTLARDRLLAMARPSAGPGSPLRLLMPTVRSPTPYFSLSPPSVPPTRSPRARPPTGRLSGVRSRSGSTTTSVDKPGYASFPTTWSSEQGENSDGERWIGRKCRFEIVVERMELVGFQMYAVEKW